jgi:hypothetical protein
VPLLKTYEAVAIAAVLQRMRDEGALPVRRPSYEQPTFWSRPLTVTAMPALAPTPAWTDMLVWAAPRQYMTVVTGIVATTVNAPAAAATDFRVVVDGNPVSGIVFAPLANLFKLPQYPVQSRPTMITVAENQTISLQARNNSLFPQVLLLALTGWSYNTINVERGSDGSGSQGVTDD